MLSSTGEDESVAKLPMMGFRENFLKLVLPAATTMLCGTFTYPVAVRVARRMFGLRGFYSIHISIAPFLAFIHVNIFGTLFALGRIKAIEYDYDRLAPKLRSKADTLSSFV